MRRYKKMFNKELEDLKNKQTEMNNTITEMKNTLEGINSRITEAEVSQKTVVEITATEQNKEQKMKRNEDSLRDICDNIKCTNVHITGVNKGEEKEKGPEKIFKDIIAKNFPNMRKETLTQVQGVQRVPYRMNPRRNMPRHILFKLAKIKEKEKILKTTREKQQITYKGIPIKFSADFSAETPQARREW